jgi:hypothetical protein
MYQPEVCVCVCVGDHYIQALMEQQVSWAAGRGLTFIRVVQLALSVLNRLMILKDSVKVRSTTFYVTLKIYKYLQVLEQ